MIVKTTTATHTVHVDSKCATPLINWPSTGNDAAEIRDTTQPGWIGARERPASETLRFDLIK